MMKRERLRKKGERGKEEAVGGGGVIKDPIPIHKKKN